MRFCFLSQFGIIDKKSIKIAPRILAFGERKTENKRAKIAVFRSVDCRYSGVLDFTFLEPT